MLFKCSQGPKPGVPYNVTVVDHSDAFSIVIHWRPPIDSDRVAVAYYQIQYKSDSENWKTLNKEKILPPQTSYTCKRSDICSMEHKKHLKHYHFYYIWILYTVTLFKVTMCLNWILTNVHIFIMYFTDLVRHLKENKKYIFRVVAFTLTGSSASSEEVIHTLLPRDKQRAIVAGLVGGILFFIVAIILSVCAVKICNRRKRRKQEKGQDDRTFKKRYFPSWLSLHLILILCHIYVGFAAYNMVACRLTDARNGGQIPTQPQVAPKRYPQKMKFSRIDLVREFITF